MVQQSCVSVVCRVCDPTNAAAPPRSALLKVPVDDRLMTTAQLRQVVAGLLGAALQGHARVDVTVLRWQGGDCHCEQELDYYFGAMGIALAPGTPTPPLIFTATAHLVPLAAEECVLMIKRKGETDLLAVNIPSKHITVAELKRRLHAMAGIPLSWDLNREQELLEDDNAPLSDYNVKHKTQLLAHPANEATRGAGLAAFGVDFADVSNGAALDKLAWSKDAPAWRVATAGLCIEGRCSNAACKAVGKMVIDNSYSMGHFDLIQEAQRCHCPACGEQIVPETCAFNRCEWMYSGTKMVQTSNGVWMPKDVKGTWVTAQNQYERFKGGSDGNGVQWRRLMFNVRPVSKKADVECPICLDLMGGAVGAPAVSLACGHAAHAACLAAWCNESSAPTCPMCRGAINAAQQRQLQAGVDPVTVLKGWGTSVAAPSSGMASKGGMAAASAPPLS